MRWSNAHNQGGCGEPAGGQRLPCQPRGVEGQAYESLPVFSVQYHPEAAPGPEHNRALFDRFVAMVREARSYHITELATSAAELAGFALESHHTRRGVAAQPRHRATEDQGLSDLFPAQG
jgi:hypothetical protein